MSKRKRDCQEFGAPRKRTKTLRPRDYTTFHVLQNASAEEREIYHQKRRMQTQLEQDLSPVYYDDEQAQKEIMFARIADETYQNPWIRAVSFDYLKTNYNEFAKLVMSLDVKIIPSERYYKYIPITRHDLRKDQNSVLRQFRVLNIKRYEYLLEDLSTQAFNCYSVPYQLWKESMNRQGISTEQGKYRIQDKDRCRLFLEHAKRELVTNEVFHPLSSLTTVTTPQDKRLYEKLKDKLVAADLRTKINNNAKKPLPEKSLQRNPEEEKHMYIPVTEKACRFICAKLNLTVEDLLDTYAKFNNVPKLTEREEKLIQENRVELAGWSSQPRNDEPVADQTVEIPDLDEPMPQRTVPMQQEKLPMQKEIVPMQQETLPMQHETVPIPGPAPKPNTINVESTTNVFNDLALSESSQEALSMDAGSDHFFSDYSQELKKMITGETPCTSGLPKSKESSAPRICETLINHGKPLMGFKSKKDELIIHFRGKKINKMEYEPELENMVLFSTKFSEKDHSSSCKENTCALRFMHEVRRSNCSDPSKPVLQDLTYDQLKKRVAAQLRSGEFQCDFKSNSAKVPSHLQVILTGKTDLKGDERYFTDIKAAMNRLYELDFFGSISGAMYCGLDVEGVTKSWENKNCKKDKSEPISTIHIASPNGIHFQIHTLFNGEKFKGVNINDCKDILDQVLLDPDVCKVGHGVTSDAWAINQTLQKGCIKNLLEAGRIHRFMNKGQAITGKYASSKLANFTDVYPNKARIFPNFNPNSLDFYDFCKDPRAWSEVQNHYNRMDPILGLYVLDRMTLWLCDFWGYANGEFGEISVALPRLMGILLLQDMSTYIGKSARKDAGMEGSKPLDSPVDFAENFGRTNPFRKTYMNSKYPIPITISRRIMEKQQIRNLPFTPVFYGMETRELVYLFEPTLQMEASLWNKNADRLAQSNFVGLSHPHICEQCGSDDHDAKDCQQVNLTCEYPFCKGDHATKVCPLIFEKCGACEIPGHKETDHDEQEFDLLRAFTTHKLFSHVHTFASIMNHKNMTLVTKKDNFEPLVVFPKKGYTGDDAKLEVKIRKI